MRKEAVCREMTGDKREVMYGYYQDIRIFFGFHQFAISKCLLLLIICKLFAVSKYCSLLFYFFFEL